MLVVSSYGSDFVCDSKKQLGRPLVSLRGGPRDSRYFPEHHKIGHQVQ
jgi:hypothetical protein